MEPSEPLSGDKRHVVVLSDVHLGTDSPTVWFQPPVHGPALEHLLRWVVDQAPHVQELVLLGDIVDLWTYAIDERPPTFAEIIATHPGVFGRDGLLAEALTALAGAVTYIAGNHDLGVTAAEVGLITDGHGRKVRLVADVPYLPTAEVLLEHGHHHTLFNAPATDGPWAPLPIGYFVTRAVATMWRRRLAPGQTVADLPNQGAPNGIDLSSLASIVGGLGAASVAAGLIDLVSGATGVGLDEPIVMPDSSAATLREVREVYSDLWTSWSTMNGGGLAGQAAAARSALADLDGSYLGWFAQRRALEQGAELVVMGHTHAPIGGLDEGLIEYVNSGFDCPSLPDQARTEAPQRITFAVVDTDPPDGDGPEASVWAVDGGCHPIDAPTARVVGSRTHDYSCYVVVDNTAGHTDLERVRHGATSGTYVVAPPDRIAAGAEGRFWLQDLAGIAGTEGTATYRRGGATEADALVFTFACPTVGTNGCSGSTSFATRTGAEPWRDQRVAHWGHPFSVAFEVR